MQVHLDGCMKLTHFASAGRRENALELDDALPLSVFLTDRERDREDAQIAAELSVSANDCKSCNNFKANKLVSQYAHLYSGDCTLGVKNGAGSLSWMCAHLKRQFSHFHSLRVHAGTKPRKIEAVSLAFRVIT